MERPQIRRTIDAAICQIDHRENTGKNCKNLVDYFQGLSLPYRITVAYDGLTIRENF